MLRFRMGLIALAFVLVGSILAGDLVNAPAAHAAIPGGGGGTYSVTATMITAGEIGVIASGTINVPGIGNLSITAANGVYFDANAVNDGSDWPVANGQQYWHDGVSGATCPSQKDNSQVDITSATPGNITASIDIWLPETGTNTPNQCVDISNPQYNLGFNDQPVTDLTTGGTINTFKGTETRTCTASKAGENCSGGYVGISLAGAASTTLFFEQSPSQIIQAGGDPAIPGNNGGQQYIYTQAADGNYVQTTGAGGVNSQCPDYIAPFSNTGLYVTAKYYTFGSAATQPCGAGTSYDILILTESPQAYFAGLGGGGGSSDTGTVGTAAPADNCPIQNWALRWLVCPVLDAIDGLVAPINAFLANLLIIPTSTFDTTTQPGKSYFTAWGDFRDIAVSFIVLVALIMVIGESAGFDLLDAYSIRKILPRLLTGGVAMTLSWVICAFIIQLFNNLINWTPDIILSPFQGLYNNGAALTPTGVLGWVENIGGGTLFAGAAAAGAAAAVVLLTVPGILSLLLSLFIAMVVAFIALTIRTMIIIIWLIASPVWMSLYILPNTQETFKLARDTGVAALTAGWLGACLIAGGQLIAILAITGKGLVPVAAPIAIVASYIGFATLIRSTNTVMGRLTGMAHGVTEGMRGGLKKYRAGQRKDALHKLSNGENRFKDTNPVSKAVNPFIKRAGLLPKAIAQNPNVFNHRNYGRNGNYRANTEGRITTAEDAEIDDILKIKSVDAIDKDDMKIWAAIETTGAGGEWARAINPQTGRANIDENLTDDERGVRQSLENHGFFRDRYDDQGNFIAGGTQEEGNLVVAQIMQAKRDSGNGTAFLRAMVKAQAGTGTGYGTDLNTGDETDDGAAQMMQWADIAWAGDTNGAGNAVLGDMRRAAGDSGRPDIGGAGAGATISAYKRVRRARTTRLNTERDIARRLRNGTIDAATAATEQEAAAKAFKTEYNQANADVVRDANEGLMPDKKAGGKPRAARIMAEESARRTVEAVAKLRVATASGNAARIAAAQRLADQQLGAVMNEYDVVSRLPKANQREYANGMTGIGLTAADVALIRGLPPPPVGAAGSSILQVGQMRTSDTVQGSRAFVEAEQRRVAIPAQQAAAVDPANIAAAAAAATAAAAAAGPSVAAQQAAAAAAHARYMQQAQEAAAAAAIAALGPIAAPRTNEAYAETRRDYQQYPPQ